MLLALVTVIIFQCLLGPVACQEGKRDDSHVENVVRQAVADEFSSEINTNRTRAYLSCASGEMVIKVNFSEPFRGVTYTDYDRSGPCKFYGDGRRYYELRIPLKGCGTKQEAPRVFINNIIVRFHRSLELEEDEIKTIICRYPPPLAPVPPPIAPLLPTAAVPAIVPPKLSEVELLLIICALLFLTLLLLGIGIAYYCLKKRNIKVIKKRKAISSGPGSEITKLSGSTMGTLSMFDPIRIPRAIAQSTSGSEAALLTSLSSQNGSGDHSDTIPSDYPSESPSSVNSDVEEIEHGGRRMMIHDLSTMRGDHFRYENTAFVPDEASSVASGYPEDQERAASVSSIPVQQILKPMEPPKKKLKQKMAREQVLTTISERDDGMLQRESLQKTYAAVRSVPNELLSPLGYSQTYVREAPPKPPSSYAPSLYGSIPDNDNRSQAEFIEDVPMAEPPSYAPSLKGSIPDNDIWSHSELESEVAVMPYTRRPKRETATVTDYFTSTQTTRDIEDELTRLRKTTTLQHKSSPPPPPPESDVESAVEVATTRALVPRKPKIVVQNIDDVYLTTTTEVRATETVTKTTKDTIAQLVKTPPQSTEPPPDDGTPPNWDVTIRHYPNQPSSEYYHHHESDDRMFERRWDAYSEANSEKFRDAESTTTEIPAHRRRRHPSEPSRPTTPKILPSPYTTLYRTTKTIPHPTYTSVIFKVLEPPAVEGVEHLTPTVKEKWRTVLTTDETFRYLVQEATTVEEYIRITKDSRYEKLFDTRTWNVIIRALSTPDDRYPKVEPPPDVRNPRYKKKNEFEPPRNRRSSLPPVTEFSLARDAPPPSVSGSVRSRRTSRSGSIPDYDLRSMTEVDVDFARNADRDSLWSVDTGYTYKTTRSLAERSTSEFLEEVPTIVAERSPSYRAGIQQQQQQRYYVEQSAAEFVQQQQHLDSYLASSSRRDYEDEYTRREQQQQHEYTRLEQQQQHHASSPTALHHDSSTYLESSSIGRRDYDDDEYTRREHAPLPMPSSSSSLRPTRPRFLERSSTEYFQDVPTLSMSDLRQESSTLAATEFASSSAATVVTSERRTDNVVRELRQNGKFSSSARSEVIIDSPIVKAAIDRASSIGEREEIKSVTETDVLDWKR